MASPQVISDPTVGRVDAKLGVIYGVAVITEGPAIGKSCIVDAITLRQMMGCAKTYAGGLKVKADHESGIASVSGFLTDFRIDGPVLRADLHLLETDPNRAKFIEMAQKIPDTFGLSVAFGGEPEMTQAGPAARCDEIYSCDLVTEPAANPNGLFSKGPAPKSALHRRFVSVSRTAFAMPMPQPAVKTPMIPKRYTDPNFKLPTLPQRPPLPGRPAIASTPPAPPQFPAGGHPGLPSAAKAVHSSIAHVGTSQGPTPNMFPGMQVPWKIAPITGGETAAAVAKTGAPIGKTSQNGVDAPTFSMATAPTAPEPKTDTPLGEAPHKPTYDACMSAMTDAVSKFGATVTEAMAPIHARVAAIEHKMGVTPGAPAAPAAQADGSGTTTPGTAPTDSYAMSSDIATMKRDIEAKIAVGISEAVKSIASEFSKSVGRTVVPPQGPTDKANADPAAQKAQEFLDRVKFHFKATNSKTTALSKASLDCPEGHQFAVKAGKKIQYV